MEEYPKRLLVISVDGCLVINEIEELASSDEVALYEFAGMAKISKKVVMIKEGKR